MIFIFKTTKIKRNLNFSYDIFNHNDERDDETIMMMLMMIRITLIVIITKIIVINLVTNSIVPSSILLHLNLQHKVLIYTLVLNILDNLSYFWNKMC